VMNEASGELNAIVARYFVQGSLLWWIPFPCAVGLAAAFRSTTETPRLSIPHAGCNQSAFDG